MAMEATFHLSLSSDSYAMLMAVADQQVLPQLQHWLGVRTCAVWAGCALAGVIAMVANAKTPKASKEILRSMSG
ncbi:hypothetical protein ACWEOE_27070 [Amycolatopsis sp. NPDC004368]